MPIFSHYRISVMMLLLCFVVGSAAAGQDAPSPETPASEGEAAGESPQDDADSSTSPELLSKRQEQLAEKYKRLEILMLTMAEFNSDSDPRRAALLKQTLSKSKDSGISTEMRELVKLLSDEQYRTATENQRDVNTALKAILALLQSEDREDQLKEEQERIKSYIKEVDRILRQQRGVQGRTEGGDDPQRLAQNQGNIADRTQRLADDIRDNEGSANSTIESATESTGEPDTDNPPSDDSDASPSESNKNSDESPTDDQQSPDTDSNQPSGDQQGQPQQGQPQQGQPQQGQPQQGQPQQGQPQQGQQQQGQQQQGQQQQGQQQQQQQSFPGQSQIEQAQQRMREAQQRLEEAQSEQAIEEQQEAQRLLEQAKAELEEILRQMREEEIERMLAGLETRFRKMLEMQIKVLEDTQAANALTGDQRANQLIVESGKLSLEERKILGEADKALLLLREEGSSVAFPEAVEQVRDDMAAVVNYLAEAQVNELTISIEQDIVTALEEMIEAIQRAQQDAEQRRQQQQQQQQQQMSPGDMPLVDAIAELKMIRSLQLRINKRTQTYAERLSNPDDQIGQAADAQLIDSLQRLSEREERIRQLTRDIVLEKNK